MTFPFPFLSTKVRPALNPVNIYTQAIPSSLSVARRNDRIVINSSRISINATRIRIKVLGNGVTLLGAFLGRQASSGSAWFMDTTDTTPARITWAGGDTVTTDTSGIWSDWIDFPIDATKNLVIAYDIGAGSIRYFAGVPSGTSYYYKSTTTQEAALPAPTGYTTGNVTSLTEIEISQ